MAKSKTRNKPIAEDRVEPRLYLLTPPLAEAGAFAPDLEAALDAGDVACVLVSLATRDEGDAKKVLRALGPLIQNRGIAMLVDADPRIAMRADADGVHVRGTGEALEQALAEAIERAKPERIVGAGGIRSRDDAMAAGEQDVDYVMFGEPAPDGWHPSAEQIAERAAWWADIFNVPCIAYAPSLADVTAMAATGADFVALRDAVWSDARGPAAALRDAQAALVSKGSA